MPLADLAALSRLESEVRSYVRAFPVVFTKARGSIMVDQQGTEYLDFFSGAGSLNYGHNDPRLKRALLDAVDDDALVQSLDLATAAQIGFLETFSRVILEPRGLRYKVQFPGPSGASAVEAALKLARLVTGRSNVIAFTHGYHGMGLGALAASADARFRSAAGHPLGNVTFAPYDGRLGEGVDTTEHLAQLLDDPGSGVDPPAAVIVETVQGEGGVNVARGSWLRSLAAVCRARGVLLIVDDIQVGCGRTGAFFSFEEAGLDPDIVTVSKALSGYGLPMAITLLKPELDVWRPGAHNGTFRGNGLAFVTATAALEAYWQDELLAGETRRKGELMRERLQAIAQRHPGLTVRGRGMIQGLAGTGRPEDVQRIARRAFENGLIVETSGAADEVLKLLPALTIDDKLLERGLGIVAASAAETLG